MAGFPRGGSALILVAWVLAACGGGAPPNDVAQGVGFSDLQSFQMRQAALRGTWVPVRTTTTVTSPIAPVSAALPPRPAAPPAAAVPPVAVARAPVATQAPIPAAAPAPAPEVASVAAAAIAALDASPRPTASAPQVALASAPPPESVANPGISDEQEFDAVAGRETIESDAARLARMQAERVVIAPTAIPERPEGLGPNIIDYALATSHPVGERRYNRRPISEERHQRACIAFRSADLAQEWFLQNGGPGRDRQGLDPDGDGYACGWNPGMFRSAAAAARN
ncbi:hypothetical protein [Roseicyclus mahoneyensis]|uniref:Excalibur calcium-binding domain-containing protein n=1 Tax=Roseicyclus mahoneyensis TaxID=164332 RepID=A0A316GKQ5_9RHOB|nr:hypothetical protein [Roseicyclus mahoneyensis]PWK61155.1 hypothetical protein C7455_103357 [Roseicyclus mahoneyensis]